MVHDDLKLAQRSDNSPSTSLARSEKPTTKIALSNKEGISDWEAGVSVAKAIMGAGSFALPWAFSKMGYIAGPLVLVLFLSLSVRSIGILVDCARFLRTRHERTQSQSIGQGGVRSISYVDVARATFGSTGAALAYTASIASSIGVCGSYLVFVALNLSSLLGRFGIQGTDEEEPAGGRRLFLILVWIVALPIAVLLSSVRDPKRFAAVSFWGDISVVAGMLAVVVYGLAFGSGSNSGQKTSSVRDCVAIGSFGDMALALGSIGYLFLIHFLVLPIESSMVGNCEDGTSSDAEAGLSTHVSTNRSQVVKDKDRFQKVVARTFVVCGSIGGIFGLIGYGLFGTNTQQIVLLNVEGSIGMAIVQSLLCIDLLLTYPVVMRPSIQILEEHWSLLVLSKRKKDGICFSNPHNENVEGDVLQMVPLTESSSCSKRSSAVSVVDSKDQSSSVTLDLDIGMNASRNNNYTTENAGHMIVCLVLGVIAAGAGSFVPAFGLLSGLVGGVSQTFLAFVLPPLMWAKQEQQKSFDETRNNQLPGDPTLSESHVNAAANAWACFGSLPWREKCLVLCGLGLIGWTLHSTWAELGKNSGGH